MASPYPAYDPRAGSSNPYAHSRPYLPREPSSDSDASESATALPRKSPEPDKAPDVRVDVRATTRTPSPTPSEVVALNKKGLVDWQAMKKRSYWFRREWLCECYGAATWRVLMCWWSARVLRHHNHRLCRYHPLYCISQADCEVDTTYSQQGARVSVDIALITPTHASLFA